MEAHAAHAAPMPIAGPMAIVDPIFMAGPMPIAEPPVRRPTVVDQTTPAQPMPRHASHDPSSPAKIKVSKPTIVEREAPPPTMREPVPPTMREPSKRRLWPLIVSIALVALVIAGAVILVRQLTGPRTKSTPGPASSAPASIPSGTAR